MAGATKIKLQTSTMVSFTGEYKAKVDDKGRIVFPAAFKLALGAGADLRFVVKSALFTDCLQMSTWAQWNAETESIRGRLNPFNREHDRLWREYMRETVIVEPDDKLGRILIPKALLEKVGIRPGTEIIFSGTGDRIEIWLKDNFDAQKLEGDEYVALAEKILGQ